MKFPFRSKSKDTLLFSSEQSIAKKCVDEIGFATCSKIRFCTSRRDAEFWGERKKLKIVKLIFYGLIGVCTEGTYHHIGMTIKKLAPIRDLNKVFVGFHEHRGMHFHTNCVKIRCGHPPDQSLYDPDNTDWYVVTDEREK